MLGQTHRPSRRTLPLQAAAMLTALLGSGAAIAGTTALTTTRVASGLALPCFVTHAPGDTSRIFILEQRSVTTGRIRILTLPDNTLLATPFLSVSPVDTDDEQGLLGLAFHPNYAQNGYFWVNYTNAAGTTIIARYQVSADPNVADAGSATTVLTITQPFANHNGGWMGFGPDGYLYISTGDGGSAGDPGNRAQDITTQLLGKMLRIDVDGPDNIPGNADDDGFPADATRLYVNPTDNPFVGVTGDDEIWAYGLRNAWRPSFDRDTGDLFIADVGQDAVEEVNFQPAGPVASVRGRNYGWRCMEGTNCTGLSGCTCNGPTLTLPIHTYTHGAGRCSITGGYVYRGCAMPDMNGLYFYADYCTAQIWSFRYSTMSGVSQFTDRTAELDPPSFAINLITSFGEDANGELYICDRGGEVFKIVPAAPIDCNADGIPDSCSTPPPPAITDQPDGQTVCSGDVVQFSVTATGTAPLSYQWQRGGSDIPGATGSTLQIQPADPGDAGSYTVVVTDACGSVTSAAAILTVELAPQISTPPADQVVCGGAALSLSVSATGTGPLSYQWRRNSVDLPGATGATYDVAAAGYADAGTYEVLVSNNCGSVLSSAAAVQVFLHSDANCDGLVNNFDIDYFVIGILNPVTAMAPAEYLVLGGTQACWDQRVCWGDTNASGTLNNFDIDGFVSCILAPPPPNNGCP